MLNIMWTNIQFLVTKVFTVDITSLQTLIWGFKINSKVYDSVVLHLDITCDIEHGSKTTCINHREVHSGEDDAELWICSNLPIVLNFATAGIQQMHKPQAQTGDVRWVLLFAACYLHQTPAPRRKVCCPSKKSNQSNIKLFIRHTLQDSTYFTG